MNQIYINSYITTIITMFIIVVVNRITSQMLRLEFPEFVTNSQTTDVGQEAALIRVMVI